MAEGSSGNSEKLLSAISTGHAAHQSFNAALEQVLKLAGPNGEKLSFDVTVPGISEQITVRQLSEQLSGTLELLGTLDGVRNTTLIPDAEITELTSRSGELKTNIDKFSTAVTEFTGAGTVTGVEVNSLIISSASGQILNVASLLAPLYRPVQNLLAAVRRLFLDRDRADFSGLAALVEELNSIRSTQQSASSDIAAVQRTVAKTEEALQQILAEARKHLQAISELAGQVPSLQEKLAKALQDASSQLQQITNVGTQAKALEQAVATYQTTFEKFQASLEGREKMLQEGSIAFETMMTNNAAAKQTLDELVDRARSVLGEATVAGLSDRFADQARTLGGNLKWSLILFFVGIALFLFSAGAVLDVFPWLSGVVHIPTREPPTVESGWPNVVFLFGSVLGKLIFLLPSLFLIGFSAKWYAALFRLRREYSYKYTVAASVPGFKVEAPQFADAIAAIAFQQLVQNPPDAAEKKDETDVGNSLLQRLIDPSIKKAVDRAMAAMEGQKK